MVDVSRSVGSVPRREAEGGERALDGELGERGEGDWAWVASHLRRVCSSTGHLSPAEAGTGGWPGGGAEDEEDEGRVEVEASMEGTDKPGEDVKGHIVGAGGWRKGRRRSVGPVRASRSGLRWVVGGS